MSRFIEVFGCQSDPVSVEGLEPLLAQVKRSLGAESAHISLSFPYFMDKKAPVSGTTGVMEYRCTLSAELTKEYTVEMGVQVPVTTLCPCSKELAKVGAHNQRSIVHVTVRPTARLCIEDLVEALEPCGSSQVYTVLKREDEKYVTEHAYANPAFVEDVARECYLTLKADKRVGAFSVRVLSYESIHNHNAYAYVSSSDTPVLSTGTVRHLREYP